MSELCYQIDVGSQTGLGAGVESTVEKQMSGELLKFATSHKVKFRLISGPYGIELLATLSDQGEEYGFLVPVAVTIEGAIEGAIVQAIGTLKRNHGIRRPAVQLPVPELLQTMPSKFSGLGWYYSRNGTRTEAKGIEKGRIRPFICVTSDGVTRNMGFDGNYQINCKSEHDLILYVGKEYPPEYGYRAYFERMTQQGS